MTKAKLAPDADVAGYLVFKLGGACALIGIAVALVAGGGPALDNWLIYSLSVALAGAFLGTLAWLCRPKAPQERGVDRLDLLAGKAAEVPVARHGRPRVSAFRTPAKATR